MARTRISTTVDSELLSAARASHPGPNDATMLDTALSALLGTLRAAEIDESYAAYDEHPLDGRDAWGDLASFHGAARRAR